MNITRPNFAAKANSLLQPAWRSCLNHLSKASLPFIAIPVMLCSVNPLSAANDIEYNRDIRPILAENCFACHGPDSASRKADLRLDRRDDAIAAKAIVEGKPDESGLLQRVLSADPETVMPPPESHKEIKPEQRELLRRWIETGANYQPHWSFIPPQPTELPSVNNQAWVRNPIDRFVLRSLEDLGLEPNPEADRATLARRAALDLIGLPPTPEMLSEFLNDSSPDAYEKYVDRLLQSEHWGEHRGRFWLDYARYADSHGIHFDNYREIWAYRDWVIKAFNAGMPFDQFTIEQLAGDLLPNPTLDQRIASGFNRCNITTNEGGVIPEEYVVLYARDRTETTSAVWMGLTTQCAVCHDHKFDPVTMQDFYSLSAFFNNTTQNPMDGNIKDTPPTIMVPLETDRPRWDALTAEVSAAKQELETRKVQSKSEFDAWIAKPETTAEFASLQAPLDGIDFYAPLDDGPGQSVSFFSAGRIRHQSFAGASQWTDGFVSAQAWQNVLGVTPEFPDAGKFERDGAFTVSAWVKLAAPNQGGALVARMDDDHDYVGWDLFAEDGKIGAHIIHKWPDDAIKVVAKERLPEGRWNHVTIIYSGTSKADGVSIYVNGMSVAQNAPTDSLKNSISTNVSLKIGQRQSGSQTPGAAVQDLRLFRRIVSEQEIRQLSQEARTAFLVAKPIANRTETDTAELFNWYLLSKDATYRDIATKVATLESEQNAIRARGTVAHVMQERPEEPQAFILSRGEYDQRRDAVKPATPVALPALAPELPRNRLGLAKWLLAPEHPLTARVTVNRFWQEVFGTGLVRTSGDFGVSGELASNQPLLDWLAIHFRESGWDTKGLFRLMVTSATYRQTATSTPDKLLKDRDNRFFSRGPRFRMDAESVRDYALAASGMLVPKIGGPSVKPYQPDGVWEAVAMIGSNTRDYVHDKGDNLYRRSLYTFWKRSAPPASMEIFNAPSRETCTVRRERTNTPLQALVTLNDPQFIEAARHLAQRSMLATSEVDLRLNWIATRVLCRPLADVELEIVRENLRELTEYYLAHADDAKALVSVGDSIADPTLPATELAAWTMVTNELFNLDEVLNK